MGTELIESPQRGSSADFHTLLLNVRSLHNNSEKKHNDLFPLKKKRYEAEE